MSASDNEMPPTRHGRIRQYLGALLHSESSEQSEANEPSHPLDPGLGTLELAQFIRRRFYEDRAWARSRRYVWSARATLIRVVVFLFSALATIFLGLATLDGFAVVGFVFSTLITAVSGLETFFNWRSRWVTADIALARWHDLEESLAFYVSATEIGKLDPSILKNYDDQRRNVWSEVSQAWIFARRNGSRGD
jgi:hypothetical protein